MAELYTLYYKSIYTKALDVNDLLIETLESGL